MARQKGAGEILYYCPRCGQPLTKHQRDIRAEKEALMRSWVKQCYEGEPPPEPDKSEHWYCTNERCVMGNKEGAVERSQGIYFNLHHPHKGIDSEPGGSWSLSFIK